MKTTMKFFAALVVMMGFAMCAMAQQNQSDYKAIDAKAQVIKALSVTAGVKLSFGTVTQGVAKTISTNGDVLQGTLGTGSTGVGAEQAGTFTIDKGLNTALTLNFTLPTNLTYLTNNLPISFADYSGNKLARLTESGLDDYPFTPTTPLSISSVLAGDYYAAGIFGVSIGGTVTPASDQAEGIYTGTITLTATYN